MFTVEQGFDACVKIQPLIPQLLESYSEILKKNVADQVQIILDAPLELPQRVDACLKVLDQFPETLAWLDKELTPPIYFKQ
jgi:hypothetical protein